MASNDFPEKIAEWFWDKNKTAISKEGEILIRALNKAAPGIKGVRYEELGPYIYGVKVERPKLVIETPAGTQRMTLMKIGFTHTDTSQDNDDSRINTLLDDIKRKIKKCWDIEAVCSVIFVLSIDALDTRQFFATEARVRSRVGIQVPKKIGKTLHVPVHTEWVVTTDAFISGIRNKIDSLKKLKKAARSETKVQLAAARRKQQEVKPKEEQSTWGGGVEAINPDVITTRTPHDDFSECS